MSFLERQHCSMTMPVIKQSHQHLRYNLNAISEPVRPRASRVISIATQWALQWQRLNWMIIMIQQNAWCYFIRSAIGTHASVHQPGHTQFALHYQGMSETDRFCNVKDIPGTNCLSPDAISNQLIIAEPAAIWDSSRPIVIGQCTSVRPVKTSGLSNQAVVASELATSRLWSFVTDTRKALTTIKKLHTR